MDRGAFGTFGEDIARRYLESQGYRILERGWHNRYGEIDLIASQGDEVVFVEVKARRSGRFGTPEEAVTPAKAARLRAAAAGYIAGSPQRVSAYRIDVIAISSGPDGRMVLRHLRGAVGED
jgi:putative endonuclease